MERAGEAAVPGPAIVPSLCGQYFSLFDRMLGNMLLPARPYFLHLSGLFAPLMSIMCAISRGWRFLLLGRMREFVAADSGSGARHYCAVRRGGCGWGGGGGVWGGGGGGAL